MVSQIVNREAPATIANLCLGFLGTTEAAKYCNTGDVCSIKTLRLQQNKLVVGVILHQQF